MGHTARQLRISTTLAIALLVASVAAANAAAPNIQIDNFGQISSTYYRGGQPQGQDYADLASLGVKTVINLTSDDAVANEQQMVSSAGMHYVQIPMTTHREPTPAQITQFLGIVNDPASQPVYVHCVGGKHRTGVMTAIYRMTSDKWSSDQAFSEMKKFQFGADFLHAEFKKFVYGFPADQARVAALNAKPDAVKAEAAAVVK